MSEEKRERMIEFWSERAKLFGHDPRTNTNDVWLREVEIRHVDGLIAKHGFRRIVDFGCANGYSTLRLAEMHQGRRFTGIDINADMIAIAQAWSEERELSNARFACRDIMVDGMEGKDADFIYAVRVFQNMESEDLQHRVLERLSMSLAPGGHLLTIESYADGYIRLNEDRLRLGLAPLPIHGHLTLLTDAFDAHAGSMLMPVARVSLSSSYYLVTRLLYSAIAKQAGEAIDYDHPIHRIGATLPQIGDYGPQRACLYQKA